MMKSFTFLIVLLLFVIPVSSSLAQQTSGDVTLDHTFYSSHDSSTCRTYVTTVYDLSITNSGMNDTVKIKNFYGFTIFSAVNTTGASLWNLDSVEIESQQLPDNYVSGNQLSKKVNTNVNKVISGPDTVEQTGPYSDGTEAGPLFSSTVPEPCSYGNVTGQVYADYDADCNYSSSTDSLAELFQHIYIDPYFSQSTGNVTGSLSGYTASGSGVNIGQYGYYNIQNSHLDSILVYIDSVYQFIYPSSGCSSIYYSFPSVPTNDVDFSLQCGGIDVQTNIGGSGNVVPGTSFLLYPNVANLGCDPVSDTLSLIIDPNVTYDPSGSPNPADSVNGDTLMWYYNNLYNLSNGAYWDSFLGGIELISDTSLTIGDSVCFAAYTGIPPNDVDSINNQLFECWNVVNSYDPNYKGVEPQGRGGAGYISDSVSKLTYTIHFQNLGTAPASKVHVVDTLDDDVVIPNSLQVLDASHSMEPKWVAGNVIKFKFDNINLIDSATNEAKSHGFVSFEIDKVQGLAPGTEIKNKAEIYFDFNPPIVTNFALNTIEYPTGIHESTVTNGELDVKVYPNPMGGHTNFQLLNTKEDEQYAFKLMDLSGRTVYERRIGEQTRFKLDRGNLETGIYLYEVADVSSGIGVRGKLVVE